MTDKKKIEEKAKRYDEAIEKLRGLLKGIHEEKCEIMKEDITKIFPELKESERIRKELLNYLYNVHDDDNERARWIDWLEEQAEYLENYDEAEKEKGDYVGNGFIKCHADFLDFKEGNTYWLEYVGDDRYIVRSNNLLGKTYHITPCQLYTIFKKQTWLEKQGKGSCQMKRSEQNLTDKVEPKFKVGDILVSDEEDRRHIYKVTAITNYDTYLLLDLEDGYTRNESVYTSDLAMYLWTIQDAKKGDVLFYTGNVKYSDGIKFDRILLFENLDTSFFVLTKCSNGVEDYGINENIDYPDNIIPATKEQKEILFMVMKEACYELDADKKELKKIEQKPAWSEEDEEIVEALNDYVKNLDILFSEIKIGDKDILSKEFRKKIQHWLKSLKDRVQPQPKQEWSEEDEKLYNSALWHIKNSCGNNGKNSGEFDVYNWFKSLKDRIQPKQEWSEEDTKALNRISAILVDASEVKNWWKEYRLIEREEMIRLIDFLKSLKERLLGK